MNRRQALERELAQKQSLLENVKLINKLPDKGQRIVDQIEAIQQKLKQYENQSPEERLKEEKQLNELSESFIKKIQVSSPKEKQEAIQKQSKKQNINFLSRTVVEQKNLILTRKTPKQLEEEILFVHGKKGAEILKQKNQKHVKLLTLEEQIEIDKQGQSELFKQILSENNENYSDMIEDEYKEENEREVIDYDDVDD